MSRDGRDGSVRDEDAAAAPAQRTIKRYTNRKLYDTSRSSYVTLEEVAEMIRRGEDVRVIDNRTQQDLTSVTLAQIIFEQQKTRRWAMPLTTLRAIIERPAELLQRLTRRSEALDEDHQVALEGVETLQSAIIDTQQQLDRRVNEALGTVPELKGEVDEIRARLEKLEATVARLTGSDEAASDED